MSVDLENVETSPNGEQTPANRIADSLPEKPGKTRKVKASKAAQLVSDDTGASPWKTYKIVHTTVEGDMLVSSLTIPVSIDAALSLDELPGAILALPHDEDGYAAYGKGRQLTPRGRSEGPKCKGAWISSKRGYKASKIAELACNQYGLSLPE